MYVLDLLSQRAFPVRRPFAGGVFQTVAPSYRERICSSNCPDAENVSMMPGSPTI
jgi:hypothetical protein